MVARVGSIEVLFRANYGSLETGANRAATSVERNSARMDKAVKRTDRSVLGLGRTMGSVRGNEFRVLALSALRAKSGVDRLAGSLLAATSLVGGLGAAFAIRGIQEYSDTYKEVGNRLRVVKNEAQSLESVENKIFDIAQKSRSQYKATGILFSRIESSAKRLNISQKDTLRVTETIQKAFLVGGSTNVESAQSAIQLSQGIASDRLAGDELRSVLENPALGQLLADKISDGDLGALRQLAKEGKLTARTVVKAFKDSSAEIDALFSKTEQTVSQALTKVDNAMLRYIGRNDAIKSGTSSTILLLNALAEDFDNIADSTVVLAGALGVLLGARALGGITSAVQTSLIAFKAQRVEMLRTATAAKALTASRLVEAETRLISVVQKANPILKAQGSTLKQVDRAQKSVTAATVAYQAAARNSTAATASLVGVQNSLKVSATAGAVAMRGLGAAMAFAGGPAGLALLALSGIYYAVSQSSADAQERVDRYADAIKTAGENSDGSSKSIRQVAEDLAKVADGASKADKALSLQQAKNDLREFTDILNDVGPSAIDGLFGQLPQQQVAFFIQSVRNLRAQFLDGRIDLKEFIDQTDGLAKGHVRFKELAVEAQNAARRIDAARGTVDGLTDSIENLDSVVSALSLSELYAPLAGIAEYQGRIRSLKGDIEKEIALEGLRGDAYKNTKASIDASSEAARKLKGLKKSGIEGTQTEIADLTKLITARNLAKNARKAQEAADRKSASASRSASRKAASAAASAAKKVAKQADNYKAKIAEINQQAATVDFSKIDQEALKIARSLKVPADELQRFTDILSGSGGDVPASIEKIRVALEALGQAEFDKSMRDLAQSNVIPFLSDLDRKTIQTARSFGVAEEQIRRFIAAGGAENGLDGLPPKIAAIRVELESINQSERLSQFGDDLADAVGTFANSAVKDFENVGDALANLGMQVADLIFQMLVIEPLKKSISGGFGSFFGGGSGGGSIASSVLAGIAHTGSKIGVDAPKGTRPVTGSQIDAAPRFHNGLNSKEFVTVLEQGERVLTENQDNRMLDAMSGLSSNIGNSSGGGGAVISIDARGAQKGVGEEIAEALKAYDRDVAPSRAIQSVSDHIKSGNSI